MQDNESDNGMVAFAHPDFIKELRELGELQEGQNLIDVPIEISKFYKGNLRVKKVRKLVNALPPTPNFAEPLLMRLYIEARDSLACGLYYPSVCMSSVAVEYALKYSIVKSESPKGFNKAAWESIEGMDFGRALQKAEKIHPEHLIKRLREFKTNVRNNYLHFEIQKMTSGREVGPVTTLRYENGEAVVETMLVRSEDAPYTWQPILEDNLETAAETILIEALSLILETVGTHE